MARDDERPVRRRTLTRDKVIAAALTLVDEHGWEQLTMSTLATRVGVVGASLYNHVRGLDDVRSEIQIRTMADLGARLREEAMGRSGTDGLRHLIAIYRSWTVANHRRYQALTAAPIDRDALISSALDANGALRAMLISCGVPEEDSLDTTVALFAAVHGFAMIEGSGFLGDEMDLDRIFYLVVRGALASIHPTHSPDSADAPHDSESAHAATEADSESARRSGEIGPVSARTADTVQPGSTAPAARQRDRAR